MQHYSSRYEGGRNVVGDQKAGLGYVFHSTDSHSSLDLDFTLHQKKQGKKDKSDYTLPLKQLQISS